jgi:mRNA-degrading endonuclease RelE of RelBE toxin-antitoxin system
VTEPTEPAHPERISVQWSPEARTDLRAIDREVALQILYCVDRYLRSRTGEVKKLKPPIPGFRLRCGDYRVFFDLKDRSTIQITAVRHRREAYR